MFSRIILTISVPSPLRYTVPMDSCGNCTWTRSTGYRILPAEQTRPETRQFVNQRPTERCWSTSSSRRHIRQTRGAVSLFPLPNIISCSASRITVICSGPNHSHSHTYKSPQTVMPLISYSRTSNLDGTTEYPEAFVVFLSPAKP